MLSYLTNAEKNSNIALLSVKLPESSPRHRDADCSKNERAFMEGWHETTGCLMTGPKTRVQRYEKNK